MINNIFSLIACRTLIVCPHFSGLVGFGIGNTDKLQAFLVTVQRQIFPVYRQRMVQHEAGKWNCMTMALTPVYLDSKH